MSQPPSTPRTLKEFAKRDELDDDAALASASAPQGQENERAESYRQSYVKALEVIEAREREIKELQSAQTRPATVEPQMKDELPLPVRLRNLAQYAEDGPQSRMVTDMIALMREAADLLNRQSSPPVEGA
jgi:hypothetical protein